MMPLTLGCVIPDSRDVVDPAPKHAPAIVSVKPNNFTKLTIPAVPGTQTIHFVLEDPDVTATLYVALFLDYTAMPAPSFTVDMPFPPGPSPTANDITRPADMMLVCGSGGIPIDNKSHVLTAVVADAVFTDTGPGPGRGRQVAPPAETAEITWDEVECQP